MRETKKFPYVIEVITLIGVILYIARSLYFAHSALSNGDEGAYLYKGYMFARGDYVPFQDYGFWTNKAPLAFLIPGYIQYWFGPGLREARYFAIIVSVLMLVGLWITTNRLGGKAWGALAVWIFALSDASTATYSQALSQGLVACMMSWMFVCTLGANRPTWKLVLGAVLSVLVVMTRQNMIVVPPLLILYIFWQHGKTAGWWSFVAAFVLFIFFHALYWPNILQLWVPWLPQSLAPFLNNFRVFSSSGVDSWKIGIFSRVQSLAKGIHDHFFVLGGFMGALILFPPAIGWKSISQFKTAVFLGLTFLVLFVMHMWASLFNQFCIQCFSTYNMFFTVAGLLFIVTVFSNRTGESVIRRIAVPIVLLFFASSVGLHYFQWWGGWSLNAIQFPRLNRIFTHGELPWASLGDVLTYMFNLPLDIQKRLASAIIGLLVGMILIILSWAFHRFFLEKKWIGKYSLTSTVLSCFLIFGVFVPPALNRDMYLSACSMSFLSNYEEAGKSLSDLVPAESIVYWKGSGRHLGLMLYLEDVRIFPSQITAGGGIMLDGDTDRLLRFGLFSESIDKQWRNSADIFIVWEDFPTIRFKDFLDQAKYEMIPFDMGNLVDCEDPLYVFEKRP